MRVAIAGHVDHGKSTILGRLLADTGALPEGKLDQVRAFCERNARPFEYAFLLDALRDERAQGITIDVARVFFKTPRRAYSIYDTPGHVEFLKNMVTGASRADAALLVVDAREGVQENSRRHAYLLALLGIRQVAVVVNKMDLVDYRQDAFDALVAAFDAHLAKIGVRPSCYVPVAGRLGENLAHRATSMAWYAGPTVLEALEAFEEARPPADLPFRMPVQDVYKFTAEGDTRRIVAGTVESGTAGPGDELVFHPSGKRSRLRRIEGFPEAVADRLAAGQACGFTLETPIYVGRGELAARAGEPAPQSGSRLRASLFWLGKRPLHAGKDYVLKLGSARVKARLERVLHVLDAATLELRENVDHVARHEAADCILALARPIAFDLGQPLPGTGRFVLVDDFEIAGGGLVREALPEAASGGRGARFHQRAQAVLLVHDGGVFDGDPGLETLLEEAGRATYQLPLAEAPLSGEVLARLAAEVRLLLDAGLLVLVPFRDGAGGEARRLAERLSLEEVRIAWVGSGPGPEGLQAEASAEPGDGRTLLHAILGWSDPNLPAARPPCRTGS